MTEPASEQPPTEHHLPAGAPRGASIVLVNTGDGKGKSSAAFGVVMRAVAAVGRSPSCSSSSRASGTSARRTSRPPRRRLVGTRRGLHVGLGRPRADQAIARDAWEHAKELIEGGDHPLVVLDEITYPMTWGWIDTAEVVATIRDRPRRSTSSRPDATRRRRSSTSPTPSPRCARSSTRTTGIEPRRASTTELGAFRLISDVFPEVLRNSPAAPKRIPKVAGRG